MVNEDKATRYQRLRSRASWLAEAVTGLFVCVMLLGGGAVALRSYAQHLAGDGIVLALVLYVVAFVLMADALTLPFAFYQGVTLERRYRLSTQSTPRWWIDRAQSTGVALVIRIGEALVLTAILWSASAYWWWLASVVFSGVLVVLARLSPVVLLPVFYRFQPLERPALAARLRSLAERANTGIVDVFEWELSDRTGRTRAVLAGLGRSRRILLSDTLLAEYSDDEIEVILAHEIAHHVHGDLWAGLLIESLRMTAGFFVASLLLDVVSPALSIGGLRDPAALPLVAVAVAATMKLLTPLAYAVSRAHERRADRYALEMTENPAAFVSAMKRLSAQNLVADRPSRFSAFYHSHPSASARIAAAHEWAAGRVR
jgi:STE24 endopeptidase